MGHKNPMAATFMAVIEHLGFSLGIFLAVIDFATDVRFLFVVVVVYFSSGSRCLDPKMWRFPSSEN